MIQRTTNPTPDAPPARPTPRIALGFLWLAVTAVALAAFAPGAAAQEQPQEPSEDAAQQEQQQDEGWLRRVWPPRREQPAEEQPDDADPEGAQERLTGDEPINVPQPAQPGRPMTDMAQTDVGTRVAPGEGDFVEFPAFAEPVEIGSLVDWISHRLQINILSDPSLAGRNVKFNGPMRVPTSELLDLLSLLVEQQGFALTQEREGWYVIRPTGEVALNLAEGEFTTTRVFNTPLVRPSALRSAVDAALAGRPGAGTSTARIAYVDELGIIIATDTPRSLRAIESVIDVILREQARQELHRFEIVNISADLARSKVIELNSPPSATGAARSAQPVGGQPAGGSPVATGMGGLSNLGERLIVDAESNSLIFRGGADEALALKSLFAVIDVPSRLIGRRYPAGPASPAITSYGERRGLGPTGSTGGAQTQGFNQQLGFRTQQRQQTGSAGATGASTSGSGFVIEDSMEAFVYFGTEAQHAQVRQLVEAFAEHARAARVVVEIYKLKHANAEDVAELLTSLVEDTRQDQYGASPFLPTGAGQRRQTGGMTYTTTEEGDTVTLSGDDGESVSFTPAEQVSIQPDISRNQVIIKAPARQQAEFGSIIERLDVRRPQVYIEAKIVSVSTSDDFTFAVESQFSPGQSVLFTNFGLTTAGDSATDRRNVRTGLSGLTAAIIKNDYVPIVINAFQRVGDTRIVSNPQLLVNDNEEAELISVREEPYSQTVQGTSTTQTSQGGVAEAGTKLTITPRISDAGMLNLEYAVELSNFDPTVARSEGLQPPKQTENYKSIVTLPSDSTMVIGGLSTESLRKSVSKVPFLGDIPIVGELFRRTERNTQQSTIYVFIRPVIMRDPNFGDLRLITEGPMLSSRLDDDTPALQPERIPVHGGAVTARPRPLPAPTEDTVAAGPPSEDDTQ